MKPQVILGANSVQELANIYPHAAFHLWHIPELDHQLVSQVKAYIGHRLVSQNVYKQGMPELNALNEMQQQFSNVLGSTPEAVIVAIGGGSLMDVAKVLRFRVGQPDWLIKNINRSLDDISLHASRQRLILLPTTAGTGSEVTGTATIWDFSNNKKHSFFGNQVYADLAIVDPQLSYGAPWAITRDSALDALSHALDSLWNHHATDETRRLAIEACKKICLNLQDLKIDLNNKDARMAMSHAALLAGQAMATTQTALVHALSYEDTLNKKVSHGYACASWIPLVWQLMMDSPCYPALETSMYAAVGDFFDSPKALYRWLEELGVHGYDPTNRTDEINQRIETVKQSPRGKNFLGFKNSHENI